ncbi:hypothetical protein BCR33DRAFT_784291 [Rhizoclosmatium globosum]|uniref:Amino acid permease/ SLC12A domain-containing protein n=1 Tax=Rhizoclosmatium globosum TaxID=329046 RepID=A0A1Y2CEN4_9FUNG|nr:hypothetical protein BCR33DRAFT_784291 [Rhizoclosmatium globosum]|eukprot:ORY45513.1 hypothetical protein BCR33DRAFT_784291 [Rhizoclosmatium globosum]
MSTQFAVATAEISKDTSNIIMHAAPEGAKLHRKLQARHLEMIAIGGSIGTGLLLKSGGAIFTAGPIGALLCFAIVGIQVFGVITGLGEMATLLPVEGIFSQIPSRFLSPAWGFASGWNYWLNWALTVPTELTAVASFMAYWVSTDQFPSWAWSGVYLVPLALLNLTSVKYLGEAEFFMSLLKVISIVIFLIVGTCVWFGAGQGSTGPLWLQTGLLRLWEMMPQADS